MCFVPTNIGISGQLVLNKLLFVIMFNGNTWTYWSKPLTAIWEKGTIYVSNYMSVVLALSLNVVLVIAFVNKLQSTECWGGGGQDGAHNMI